MRVCMFPLVQTQFLAWIEHMESWLSSRPGRNSNTELLHLSVFHQKTESSTLHQIVYLSTCCNAMYRHCLVFLQTTSARYTAIRLIRLSYRRGSRQCSSHYLVNYRASLGVRL